MICKHTIDALPQRIAIGIEADNVSTVVEIDCAAWLAKWPGMTFSLWVTRPGEETPYPAATSMVGPVLTWTITRSDVAIVGEGRAEIVGQTPGDTVKHSRSFGTLIDATITDVGPVPPDPAKPWIEKVAADAARAEQGAKDAEDAAGAAAGSEQAARKSAEDARLDATRAKASKEAAEAAAEKAEAAERGAQQQADRLAGIGAQAVGIPFGEKPRVESDGKIITYYMPAGEPGKPGKDGADGKDGVNGLPGARGPQGPEGQRGPQGDQGVPGIQGGIGPTGAQGPQGKPGPKGDSGVYVGPGPVPAGDNVWINPDGTGSVIDIVEIDDVNASPDKVYSSKKTEESINAVYGYYQPRFILGHMFPGARKRIDISSIADPLTVRLTFPDDTLLEYSGQAFRIDGQHDIIPPSTTSALCIYFDTQGKVFVAKEWKSPFTGADVKRYAFIMSLRRDYFDASRFVAVDCSFPYTLNGVYPPEIPAYQIPYCIPAKEETVGVIDFSLAEDDNPSAERKLKITVPFDTLVCVRGMWASLQSGEYVATNASNNVATSAVIVYYDTLYSVFKTRAYNDTFKSLEDQSRYTVFAAVRYGRNGIVGVSCLAEHTINGNTATPMTKEEALYTPASADMGFCRAVNHKGWHEAPENTLPAYAESKKHGFAWVETDVQFTADGVPVLLHDGTIDRTSNGTGAISGMTYAQASAFDFGAWKNAKYAGTKIPKLDEFLRLCYRVGLNVYLEIKGGINTEQANTIVSMVKTSNMSKHVEYISFSLSSLEKIKTIDEKAALHIVAGKLPAEWESQYNGLKIDTNKVSFDLGDGAHMDQAASILAPREIPLEVWTVNSPARIIELPNYVSAITSDSQHCNKVFIEEAI